LFLGCFNLCLALLERGNRSLPTGVGLLKFLAQTCSGPGQRSLSLGFQLIARQIGTRCGHAGLCCLDCRVLKRLGREVILDCSLGTGDGCLSLSNLRAIIVISNLDEDVTSVNPVVIVDEDVLHVSADASRERGEIAAQVRIIGRLPAGCADPMPPAQRDRDDDRRRCAQSQGWRQNSSPNSRAEGRCLRR